MKGSILFFFLTVFIGWCHAEDSVTSTNTAISTSNAYGYPTSIGGLGQSQAEINFHATSGPQMPHPGIPGAPSPQIFSGRTDAPAKVVGLPMMSMYEVVCRPTYSRKYPIESKAYDGESGKTTIVFVNHDNYPRYRRENVEPENVVITFPESGRRYHCIGILTITGKRDARDGYDFGTIKSDAANFALKELSGFPGYLLLMDNSAVAAATGVTAKGGGQGLGLGISHAFNIMTGGVLTPGFSSGQGDTFADAQLGMTAIVVVPTRDTSGVTFPIRERVAKK